MSKDMKLIMENWRHYQLLTEIDQNDPITWEQFRGLLKAMLGAKQGLVGQALAKFAGLTGLFGTDKESAASDAAQISGWVVDMLKENKEGDRLLLSEVIVLGTVLVGLKALGAIGLAKNLVGFGQKVFRKLKGQPTDKTDKLPFLDLINLDPEYSKILDDEIEEEFLKWWLKDIENKTGNMEEEDLDVNSKMQEFIKTKYNRGLGEPPAHNPPNTVYQGMALGSGSALKRTKRAVRKKQAAAAIGAQI